MLVCAGSCYQGAVESLPMGPEKIGDEKHLEQIVPTTLPLMKPVLASLGGDPICAHRGLRQPFSFFPAARVDPLEHVGDKSIRPYCIGQG